MEDYFKENILNNSRISDIRDKVIIKNNPEMTNNFPNNYSASVSLKLKDGSVLKKTNLDAKGDPENPMTQKEICDKTLNLINSNFSGLEDINVLIQDIISNEVYDLEKKLNWFDDLQLLINLYIFSSLLTPIPSNISRSTNTSLLNIDSLDL